MDQDFLEKFIKEGNKKADFIKQQGKKPAIIKILEEHGRTPKDLEDIFYKLMGAGADEITSSKVISDATLLQKYFELLKGGMSDLELALVLRKQVVGY